METHHYFRSNLLCQENVLFAPRKRTKNKQANKKYNTKQNIRLKKITLKIARRKRFKRTTFMSGPASIITYCESNEGELNDFIA